MSRNLALFTLFALLAILLISTIALAVKTCPVCDRQNSDTMKYCMHCGALLPTTGDTEGVEPYTGGFEGMGLVVTIDAHYSALNWDKPPREYYWHFRVTLMGVGSEYGELNVTREFNTQSVALQEMIHCPKGNYALEVEVIRKVKDTYTTEYKYQRVIFTDEEPQHEFSILIAGGELVILTLDGEKTEAILFKQ